MNECSIQTHFSRIDSGVDDMRFKFKAKRWSHVVKVTTTIKKNRWNAFLCTFKVGENCHISHTSLILISFSITKSDILSCQSGLEFIPVMITLLRINANTVYQHFESLHPLIFIRKSCHIIGIGDCSLQLTKTTQWFTKYALAKINKPAP